MNRCRLFLFAVVSTAILASCTKEVPAPEGDGEQTVFTATIESPIAKTAISGTSVTWLAGDAISIFDGGTNVKSVVSGSGNSASFSATLSTPGPWYALYPYDGDAGVSGGEFTATLPSEQKGVAGSFANGLNIAVAISEGNALHFKNVLSYIKVKVTNNLVSKIVLTGKHFEEIAGKIRINYNAGAPAYELEGNGAKSISLIPETRYFLPGQFYYIAVLPQTLAGGFNLNYVDAFGDEHPLASSSDVVLARASLLNIGSPDKDLALDGPIVFADPDVKADLLAAGIGGGIETGEIYKSEAAAVPYEKLYSYDGTISGSSPNQVCTSSSLWSNPDNVDTFDELRYFVNLYRTANEVRLPILFAGCTKLTSVKLPCNVTSISNYCFQNCTSLKTIELPSTVQKIFSYAFGGCTGLTGAIDIPAGVIQISNCVFLNCTGITKINFLAVGENVLETVGNYAFDGCKNMAFNTRNFRKLKSIGQYAFRLTAIKNMTINCEELTSLPKNAFYQCKSLENVYLSPNIKTIDQFCFSGCIKLTGLSYLGVSQLGINLPEGLTTLGTATFGGCELIKNVIFPSTITSIGKNIFRSENINSTERVINLESWTVKASAVPSLGEEPFLKKTTTGSVASIIVPPESLGDYRKATNWSAFAPVMTGYDFAPANLTVYGDVVDIRTWGSTHDKHKYIFPLGQRTHRECFSDLSTDDLGRFPGAKYAASHWNVHGIESVSASGHCDIMIATPASIASSTGWTPVGKSFVIPNAVTYNCYKYSYTSEMASAGARLAIPHHDSWSTIVFGTDGNLSVDAPDAPCTIIDLARTIRNNTTNNPGIHIRPDGTFVAWQTESINTGFVYLSSDRGATWTRTSDALRQSYCGIYEHDGVLYMFGCDANGGNITVQVSRDGYDWSGNNIIVPKTPEGFHGSSSPCVESGGRVYRAMSEKGTEEWGVILISAPIGSDLTRASSWTVSNIVYYNKDWLPGDSSTGWQEPALVKRKDGSLCIIMRIDGTYYKEYAALVEVNSPTSISYSRIFAMPGAAKRLTIDYDAQSDKYWCLVSPYYVNSRSDYSLSPVACRNSMVLISSPDLINWTKERTCIYSDNPYNNSYHYIDWRFDGDDLVSTFRCSADESRGLAYSYHDSNAFGYFRVRNFRNGSSVAPILVDTPVTSGAPVVPDML